MERRNEKVSNSSKRRRIERQKKRNEINQQGDNIIPDQFAPIENIYQLEINDMKDMNLRNELSDQK